jgi:aspartate aminotransferase-like enzyme
MRQQQHFCKRIRKGSNKLGFSVETEAIARPLLNEHNIEVGGGLGEIAGKVWRVGLMGHNSRLESVDRLVVALNQVKVRTVSDR